MFSEKIIIVRQSLNNKITERIREIESIQNTPEFKKFLSYLQDNKELLKIEEDIKQENIIL